MKRFFIITSLFLFQTSYAENVIYKCTSDTGEITYQNNVGDKKECNKTNFASFPNINFFKSEPPKTKVINNNSSNPDIKPSSIVTTNPNNISDDQKIRDGKRILILTQELSQEKEQLNTVSLMLTKLKDSNSKDNSQISKLEELKSSHINNITAIERELGNNKSFIKPEELKIERATIQPNLNNQNMMVTNPVNPTPTLLLPLSLPEPAPIPTFVKPTNIKKEIISINNVEKKTTIIENKKTLSNETPLVEKRKSNRLGNTVTNSSGLSNMSKVKN